METVLDGLPPGARVAVVRLRSMGDCVLATPALEILKQSRPDLRVSLVVEDRFAPLFEGNPDVDEILPPRLAALRAAQPALCLNLHGGGRSARLTALSRAPIRAGFAHFSAQFVYNTAIPTAQEILGVERKVHTAEHMAAAMFYLGARSREIGRAKLFARGGRLLDAPYAVIHPVASAQDKTWPAAGFVAVADHLRRESGLDPVFIGAPSDDLSAFGAFRTMAGLPLADVKRLLRDAAVFVGNDSGPAHMAAAFGLPVVVIFGASDPVVWGPWRTDSQTIIAGADIAQTDAGQVLGALARLKVAA